MVHEVLLLLTSIVFFTEINVFLNLAELAYMEQTASIYPWQLWFAGSFAVKL
jgi:hypothetical protein